MGSNQAVFFFERADTMAEIDSLDIKIKSEANNAIKALDNLIKKLDIVAGAMSNVFDNKGIKEINKSMDSVSQNMGAMKKKLNDVSSSIDQPIKKAGDLLRDLSEKYKDFGKNFQFFGDEKQTQKQLERYRNLLEKAKLNEERLRTSGDIESPRYEKAIADLSAYSNIVKNLEEQLLKLGKEMKSIQTPSVDDSLDSLGEKTKDALTTYKKYLSEFDEEFEKALSNTGFVLPTSPLDEMLERLKNDLPEAEEMIESYEAMIERVNKINSIMPKKQFDMKAWENQLTKTIKIPEIDTAKIEEKIAELQDKYKNIGADFEFFGDLDDINSELDRVTQKLDGFVEKERRIATSPSVDINALDRVEENISKFSNMQAILEDLRQRTERFESSLQGLKVPEIQEENLHKLQSALSKTEGEFDRLRLKMENGFATGRITQTIDDKGYRSLREQIALSEKTAESLRQKIAEVTEKAGEEAARAAEVFEENLGNLQIPEIKTNSLKQLEKDLQKAEADLDKFRAKLQNDITMGRIKADFSDPGYRKSAEQIALTEKRITAIKEKMKTASAESGKTQGYSKLAGAMSSISSAGKKLWKIFTGLVQQIRRFASSVAKLAVSGMKKMVSATRKISAGTKNLVKSLAESTKESRKHDKSLKDSIKTILKYTLSIRSLFMLIRKLKGAFKDGLDNLVQYSGEVNHSVSLLTSGVLSLKNGIAVSLAPVINTIAPYIERFMDLMLSAANATGRFFAALTGKTVAVQAKKVYKDYADSLNGVADAAKDAAKAIGTIGIDELNILSENKADNAGDIGIEDMFEDVEIGKDVEDWAKRIRDAFLSQDWEELGKTIAELVNEGLRKVYDTITGITPKVEQALKDFAQVFNSFVEWLDWDLLGRNIGAGINLITTAINALFGDGGIDLENLGRKLSEGLRGMIDEVDWTGLGNAIGNWFMVAWRIAEGFVEDMWRIDPETLLTGWEEAGIAIAESVNGIFDRIDFGSIGATLASGLNGLFEILRSFNEKMAAKETWQKIANNISKGLNNAISGIRPIEAAQALGQFVTDLLGTMLKVAETTPWNKLGQKIGQFLVKIPWKKIFWQVFDIITNVLGGLFGGLATEILYNFDKIGTALADGFNEAFQRLREFTKTVPWGAIAENIYIGLNNMIHGINWEEAGRTLSDFVMKLLGVFREVAEKTDWEGLGRGIGQFLSNIDWWGIFKSVFDIIWNVLSGLIAGLLDTKSGKVIVAISAGLAVIRTLVKGIEIINAAKSLFSGLSLVFQAIGAIFTPQGALIAAIVAGVVLIVANWDKIKEAAGKVKDWVVEKWNAIADKTREIWGKTTGFLQDTWTKVKDWAAGAFGQTSKTISEEWTKVEKNTEKSWENIRSTTGKKISETVKDISSKFSGLSETMDENGKRAIASFGKGMNSSKETIDKSAKDVSKTINDSLNEIDYEKIGSDMMNKLSNGIEKSKGVLQKSVSDINDMLSRTVSNVNSAVDKVKNAMGSIGKGGTSTRSSYSYSVPKYATGGFPEDGLFYANHTELVGQFTNGQTAVANNAQIVEGIKYGVREAVAEVLAPYLADIAQNTRETADKDMSVRITDSDIVSSYKRGTARQGYSFT